VGRHYGSGVLKHEPREVESIRVPWALEANIQALSDTVAEVDAWLRDDQPVQARQTADEFFRQYAENYSKNYIRRLEASLCELRHRRIPPKRRANLAKNQPTPT